MNDEMNLIFDYLYHVGQFSLSSGKLTYDKAFNLLDITIDIGNYAIYSDDCIDLLGPTQSSVLKQTLRIIREKLPIEEQLSSSLRSLLLDTSSCNIILIDDSSVQCPATGDYIFTIKEGARCFLYIVNTTTATLFRESNSPDLFNKLNKLAEGKQMSMFKSNDTTEDLLNVYVYKQKSKDLCSTFADLINAVGGKSLDTKFNKYLSDVLHV